MALFIYDFWYQPHHNVMISSEWGHIRCLVDGLNLADVEAGNYGTHLNVFDWKNRKLIQRIDLGIEGEVTIVNVSLDRLIVVKYNNSWPKTVEPIWCVKINYDTPIPPWAH